MSSAYELMGLIAIQFAPALLLLVVLTYLDRSD